MSSSPAERIHVYGRVRPPAAHDTSPCLTLDRDGVTLFCRRVGEGPPKTSMPPPPRMKHVVESPSFTLDGVMGDMHTRATQDFLNSIAHSCVVDSLLRGTSVTIVCCGGSASGKTTTVFGDVAVPGLCQRILNSLFAAAVSQSEASPYGAQSLAAAAAAAASPMLDRSSSFPVGGAQKEEEEWLCASQRRCTVQLSYVALQGENFVDLLAEETSGASASRSASPRELTPMSPVTSSSLSASQMPTITMDLGGKVFLNNVLKEECCSPEDALALINRGRRAQAASAARGSAGHAVLIVDVVCEEGLEGSVNHHATRKAQLHLVDLAAPKPLVRLPQTPRLLPPRAPLSSASNSKPSADANISSQKVFADTAAIKRSLVALQEVITKLASMPVGAALQRPSLFKRSKLTMLLKGHLGGSCRTLVIAHVRPEQAHGEDSLATLQLARRFLCVPEKPTCRVTEDPFTELNKLRRQVSALQMELRLQTELNAFEFGGASSGAAAPGSENRQAVSPKAKGAGKRDGNVSPLPTQQHLFSSSSGGSADRKPSLSKTLSGAVADCHPLLCRPSSSSAAPVTNALAKRVTDFVAGRIAVLSVASVLEMHTCFELLRQCIVERDVQLAAALADLQSVEAVTSSAFTASALASTRSSALERSVGRANTADRPPGSAGSRRRSLSSTRLMLSSASDTPAAEGAEYASGNPSSSMATTPSFKLNSSRTALLREPSPSVAALDVNKTGKGYGSAPSAAVSFGGVGRHLFSRYSTLKNTELPWTSLNTVPDVPMGLAEGAQKMSGGIEAAGGGATLHTTRGVVSSPTYRKAPESKIGSLSVEGSKDISSPHVSTEGQALTQWGQEQVDLSGSSSTIAAHSTTQTLGPHLENSAVPAVPAPQPSVPESSAYTFYVTTTEEGIEQMQRIRRVKETLESLRACLAWKMTDRGIQDDTSLRNQYDICESHLARLREELLKGFELWYEAGLAPRGSRIATENCAEPHSLSGTGGNSDRVTLDTMRRRLRRLPVGGVSSAAGGGVEGRLSGGNINDTRVGDTHTSQRGFVSVPRLGDCLS